MMNRVTLNSIQCAQLNQAQWPIEVCDESGRTVGFFLTKEAFYKSMDVPISDEEFDRRLKAGGGRTWAEIRADLEKQYGPASP